MTQWEYRVITITIDLEKKDGRHETHRERDERIEGELAARGVDGWELVSFVPVATITRSHVPWMYHAVFKRIAQ